jgi:hypothetical protein
MEEAMIGFVCTTINPNSDFLHKNIDLFKSEGMPSYIVLDRKITDNFSPPYINFRDNFLNEYERLCDWDSYSRKNIGFIRAAKECEYIFETDDDNLVLMRPSEMIEAFKADSGIILKNDIVNIFKYIYPDVDCNIWARGFPIDKIDNVISRNVKKEPLHDYTIGVVQFLVQGNPDVDAMYRLVNGADVDVKTADSFNNILLQGGFHPFNSQGTLWKKDYFPLAYLPSTCEFRMTDIWRGYIAQCILFAHGSGVLFTKPGLMQDRNPHSIYSDFIGEHRGYIESNKVLKIVENISTQNIGDMMLRIYEELGKAKIFNTKKEMILLDAFLNEII